MALEKVTYVDGKTVITADQLNAIQDAILENTNNIPNDEHINELISTALGVVENGTY